MFILNKDTNLIQECSNNDVIKICKKDSEHFTVADTMEELSKGKEAQKAADEKAAEEAAKKAAEAEQKAKEEAEQKAAEELKAKEDEEARKAAEEAQKAADETNGGATPPEGDEEQKSQKEIYSGMNVENLRKVAKEKGIQGYSNMNKETLIAVIIAHESE